MKPHRAPEVYWAMFATWVLMSFPAQSSLPRQVFRSPERFSVRDPIIKVFIKDFDAQVVVPSTIRLFLNNMELTPLVINDTPDGAEAQYTVRDLLPVGSRHSASVIYGENDPFAPLRTNTWTFEVTPLTRDTLFIEAEDFNYSNDGVTGGLHANFGDPDCSLIGKHAVRFVDYFEQTTAICSQLTVASPELKHVLRTPITCAASGLSLATTSLDRTNPVTG